jgi:hypothetical protein
MTNRPGERLPSWGLRLIHELDAADGRAVALAQTLTPRQLNWTSAPGVWSVGQCLEHLCVANEVYLKAMPSSFADHRPSVVQEIAPGWFGRWFIRAYIEPKPKVTPRRAPRMIKPGATVDPSILDRFLRTNRDIRDLVQRAGDYDVNRIRFRNPLVPVIWFTIGTGLEVLSKHERRHLLQAERVKESPGFPAH